MLSLDKVFDAQTVLKSIIRETNVVKTYGIAPDCDLYLKPENLQITGSFKVRGSAYKISQLSAEEKQDRIRAGLKGAIWTALVFCLLISAAIWFLARPLMLLFVDAGETAILSEGIRYLHIEGAFYCGIGCLFLLYGLYRAVGRPGMSVVLTVISLGTRVALAYILSALPSVGVVGIWWSVPIGWFLADAVGLVYYWKCRKRLLRSSSTENMVK